MASPGQVYAHYYAKNAEYAITEGPSLLALAKSRAQNIGNRMRSQASERSKQQYANLLNSIFTRPSQDKRDFNDTRARKILENLVLTKANQHFNVDWDSGRVQKVIDNPEAVFKPNQNIRKFNNQNFMSDQTFEQLIITIKQIISDMSTRSTLSREDPQQIIAKLEQALVTLSKNIKVAANQIEDPSLKALLSYVEKNSNIKGWISVKDVQTQNLLTFINDLISTYYYAYTGAIVEQGNLFEEAGIMAGLLLHEMSLDTIEQYLQQTLTETDLAASKVGRYNSVSPNLQYTTEFIPSKMRKRSFLQKEQKNINGTVVTSTKSSQQKIDVIVDLADDNYKRVPTTMSFKSYDLSRPIKLVGGTNLWYLMQDEPLEFINTYLDIMVDRKESIQRLNKMARHKQKQKGKAANAGEWFAGFKSGIQVHDERRVFTALKTQRKYAIVAAEIMAFSKALTGATFGRIGAKLMVVNDIATKQIYVIEMKDIIDYVINALNMGTPLNKLIELEDGTNFNIFYQNKWSNHSKEDRIANLINQLHKQTISMALRPSVIQNVSKIIGE